MKVAILDGCDRDVRIPEDRSNSCIVTAEHLACWNSVSSVTYSDFRTDREKLHQSLHARRCARGTVDVHEVAAVGVIYLGHLSALSKATVEVATEVNELLHMLETQSELSKQ